ncbi:helicase associated domain-containing protein [Streptomyces sp. NPDC002766]|uniref:helicase associated domain-containing protein n=1 Tax=Streptomyces sp. NPDC002766 TaxID=3154429 RepID=UPI0033239DA7
MHASAWEAGLDVARAYAAVHGHCLPAASTVFDGYALGVFMKNARQGAKRARENAVRRANGETGVSYAGELSEARREALDEIDPGWCPEWDIVWQRNLRLLMAHVKAGGTLPARPGEVVVQGEDLGAWIAAQRAGWGELRRAQQWLLESIGVDPDEAVALRPVVRSKADRGDQPRRRPTVPRPRRPSPGPAQACRVRQRRRGCGRGGRPDGREAGGHGSTTPAAEPQS